MKFLLCAKQATKRECQRISVCLLNVKTISTTSDSKVMFTFLDDTTLVVDTPTPEKLYSELRKLNLLIEFDVSG